MSCASSCTQIARNVTTNELANWQRYRYLKAPDGSFTNPFDRGCKKNCADAMFPSKQRAPVMIMEDAGEHSSLLKMEQGEVLTSGNLKGQ